ncbi:MAG: hypothetical protein ACR2KW_06525 [Rubrobacter sp.]
MTQRTPASDYRKKAERGLADIYRQMQRAGHPKPLGDPLFGVVIILEQPVGPRVIQAISLSLDAVNFPDAYVTFTATGMLNRELRLTEPRILVAVGSEAAREIDELQNPLSLGKFADATPGTPFPWKRNTAGLLLPSLAPVLDDEPGKRRFWSAFLALKTLT